MSAAMSGQPGEQPLLNDAIRRQVQEALAEVEQPVKLVVFTQGESEGLPDGAHVPAPECAMCHDNRRLMVEVAATNPKLSVEVYDFVADAEACRRFGIDKIPAAAILASGPAGDVDYGIRYYGIPAGYEFSSLIEDIRVVGRRSPDLLPATLEMLAQIEQPVHIQVFVTPT